MKLNKLEKIQFIYDFIGSLFFALLLGSVCAFFVNPSSGHQYVYTNWDSFHLFLPLVFYLVLTYLFWTSDFLSRFRLNFLWIFINSTSVFVSLFFTFLISDIANDRLFTEKSKFSSFDFVLVVVGLLILVSVFSASFFWYVGLIHRIVFENKNEQLELNLVD